MYAFSWNDDKTLLGIQHFDPMRLNDIIGYEKQKEQLTANTAAFLAGKPANNVLLVGARGTGKSSAVKALANEYFSQGLRLVQLTKQQLVELPLIMKALRKFASKKFIIFLDDLSFEGFETEYKHLKSAIEGGVEVMVNDGNIFVLIWHPVVDDEAEAVRKGNGFVDTVVFVKLILPVLTITPGFFDKMATVGGRIDKYIGRFYLYTAFNC